MFREPSGVVRRRPLADHALPHESCLWLESKGERLSMLRGWQGPLPRHQRSRGLQRRQRHQMRTRRARAQSMLQLWLRLRALSENGRGDLLRFTRRPRRRLVLAHGFRYPNGHESATRARANPACMATCPQNRGRPARGFCPQCMLQDARWRLRSAFQRARAAMCWSRCYWPCP
jgi:hypothetical protein